MISRESILKRIKEVVYNNEPEATVILFGSFARGDTHPESDIDLLILSNKEKISWEDGKKIRYDLYDIELETGQLISPIVKSRKDWYSRYKVTPFFQSVSSDGIVL